jgi:hypothetical protein
MKEQDKDQIETQAGFGEIVDNFVQNVESFWITLPLVKGFVEIVRDGIHKEYLDFLEANGKKDSTDQPDSPISYLVPGEKVSEANSLKKKFEAIDIANSVVPESFIVSLVSQFDVHLGKLIKAMFYIKPETINASEKNLPFSELLKFNSIEDAREFIIEKEIETLLRESHAEHFKWLENKLGITLKKDLEVWPDFIELTERRNLYVHNDGIVSNQYLTVCKENGVVIPDDIKLGTKLSISKAYFNKSIEVVYEIGVKLAHVIWRKLQVAEREAADQHLNNIGYKLTSSGQYNLAIRILNFGAHVIKNHSSQEIKTMMLVNIAQAYKWNEESQECQKILDSIDWSALDTKFRLSNLVLKDDFDNAAILMNKMGSNGDIEKQHYKEWPVFREFRKSQQFRDAYHKIFGEEYYFQESSTSTILIQFSDGKTEGKRND